MHKRNLNLIIMMFLVSVFFCNGCGSGKDLIHHETVDVEISSQTTQYKTGTIVIKDTYENNNSRDFTPKSPVGKVHFGPQEIKFEP